MSQARRNRRVPAVMLACAVLLAAGSGCRHSPFHRVADSPRPDSVAGLERSAVPELAPVVATKASPATEAASAEAEPGDDSEAVAAAAPAPTPMLDAALRRAEAEEEAERRSLQEALAPRREPEPEPQPEVASAPTAPPPSRPEPLEPEVIAPALVAEAAAAPMPEPASEVQAPDEAQGPEPAEPRVDPAVEPAAVEVHRTDDAQAAALKDAHLERIDPPAPATATEAAPEPEPAPLPIPPQPQPPTSATDDSAPQGEEFRIRTARLCRKIHGFGSFEPMNANALKPGRSALVYCELGGLDYRAEGEEFVSHVATRVELVRDEDDAKVWEVAGDAEDRCRAKRRDSYVGTLVTLPESLAPGAYTLRLSQTDATSGRTAAAEIAVTIAR